MVFNREVGLKRNFRLMFWIQALTEVKVINVISAIFYVHRGLTLSQIFYLALAFAITSIIIEVPSSYLADKFGRQKMIILSLVVGITYWISNIFAFGFPAFLVATSLYALSYSIMSGTDEALVYDSAKELNQDSQSLRKLGQFYSAQRIFKIITPLIAVLLAKNLVDWQFNLILGIDVIANILALTLSLFLVEPRRHYYVEPSQSGIMLGAIRLIRHHPTLLRIIINRTIIFITGFMIWRISSEYFQNIGVPVILIGLATVIQQLTIFIFNLNTHRWLTHLSSEKIVNRLNLVNFSAITLLLLADIFFRHWSINLILYSLIMVSETIRWPYFSDLFNRHSLSHNRATTLSLSGIFVSLFQIPIFILSSIVINWGYSSIFTLTLVLALSTNLFFRLAPANVKIGQ